MKRQQLEVVVFTVLAEGLLFNEAWNFYHQRPDLVALNTTVVLYGPFILGALYVAFRLWTRPAKQSVITKRITPMTIAIGEYEAKPTEENAVKVKRLLDLDQKKAFSDSLSTKYER
jgi:hypothetical protein